MKKKLLAMSLVAVMLTTVGCSNSDKESAEDTNKKTEVTAEQQANTANKLNFESLYPNEEIRAYAQKMIGTKAPEFTFKNLKGEEIQLSKLKGQNIVVEIASTTCPACIEAFPTVKEFKDVNGEEVKVLTVFPNETKADVENFFKTNKYAKDETVIAGEGMNTMIADYQVQYTPTFIFVDKEGYIQFVHVGGDVSDVVLSSMSDLAFKTNLSDKFNTVEEVELEKSTPETTTDSSTDKK